MDLQPHLQRIRARHAELEALLSQPATPVAVLTAATRELAELAPLVEADTARARAAASLDELDRLLADPAADADLRELAYDEQPEATAALAASEAALRRLLIPRDADDHRSAILEVRAGTGGDEAALFAGDLLGMYRRYAALQGWQFQVLEAAETDLGGLREAVAQIQGHGVFARLKFESGVHRVQRVPRTETQGRIHTSAATVAVLPEVEPVEIALEEKDLRIDVFRSSGPGGQSVNTTDSAVRITHLPTGITVSQQDEKSQHRNKAKALKILAARLHDRVRSEVDASRAAQRRDQVGSGDRSERIRTYNFPQGRVTDHRIELTVHRLPEILVGTALDMLIEPLLAQDEAERLATLA